MPGEPGADCKTISCNGELSRELSAEYSIMKASVEEEKLKLVSVSNYLNYTPKNE